MRALVDQGVDCEGNKPFCEANVVTQALRDDVEMAARRHTLFADFLAQRRFNLPNL